jgi:Icc-related predicted phosphoesterase
MIGLKNIKRNNMKTWVISDTHDLHQYLSIPKDVECVIHCGDSTNHGHLIPNNEEYLRFIEWVINLDIKHKILIAGNHDAWATKKYNRDYIKDKGIIYLEHEYYELEGRVLFGSPYTPTFGNWYFMKDRSKLNKYWEQLTNIDILITHGPPKTILDLSHNKDHKLEYCGDSALLKHVLRIKPSFHCFGHIHNSEGCYNQGIRVFNDITFINASVVEDGKFSKGTTSNGVIIEI